MRMSVCLKGLAAFQDFHRDFRPKMLNGPQDVEERTLCENPFFLKKKENCL